MLTEVKTPLEQSREPMRLGHCSATFVPHSLDHLGARVFLVLDTSAMHEIVNLSADDARRLAERLKIAACEAEAMQKKKRAREQQQKMTIA